MLCHRGFIIMIIMKMNCVQAGEPKEASGYLCHHKEVCMFAVFSEEKWITVCMFLSLVLGICLRIMIGILYQHMIKETGNMSATENKVLKQCKLKFANCFQLNDGVANVPVFVDKFLGKLRLGPFSYQTLYHLSGQLVLLSVFFAGVGSCRCIISGHTLGQILPFYIVSFLGMYVFFSVSGIVDVKGRRRVLKTYLVDYLENHMSNRLRAGTYEEEQGKRKNRERRTDIELMPVRGREEGTLSYAKPATAFEEDKGEERIAGQAAGLLNRIQEKELEELLKEFLTS